MVICPVCGVEVVIPPNAKSGDVVVCPVCYARLQVTSDGSGTWNCEVV